MPRDLATELLCGGVSPSWLAALGPFPCRTVASYCGKQTLARRANLCALLSLTLALWGSQGHWGLPGTHRVATEVV